MTPEARLALRSVLGQVQEQTNFLQTGLGTSTSTTTTTSTTAVPQVQVTVTLPVAEDPHPEGQWKKCVDGTPNCGLLHDLMSLEWGKFRDSFDELTAEMNQNQEEYDNAKRNINEEITAITEQKTKHQEALAQ